MSHASPIERTTEPERQVSVVQRCLAVVSIVLLPIGVLMVVYGFITGLPQLIGAVFALALAALCVWQSLGHRRMARWVWSVCAAVFLVLTAVLVYASGREVLWLAIGTIVAAIGGTAGRTALLRAPRPEGRHHLRRPLHQPAHPILFVNPRREMAPPDASVWSLPARRRGSRWSSCRRATT